MKLAMSIAAMTLSMSACAAPLSVNTMLDSTVYLVNQEGTYCSGFITPDHKVITAAHCISNPKELVTVKFHDDSKHVFHVQKLGSADKGPDLAQLMSAETFVNKGIPLCTFDPYYKESLTMIGAPLGEEDTVSIEHVSNPHTKVGEEDYSMIRFEGNLLPGNSGGPAIDDKEGCVIGTADETQVEVPQLAAYGLSYGLNYLTPISQLGLIKGPY
jgi:S1-C subfamily serine protease